MQGVQAGSKRCIGIPSVFRLEFGLGDPEPVIGLVDSPVEGLAPVALISFRPCDPATRLRYHQGAALQLTYLNRHPVELPQSVVKKVSESVASDPGLTHRKLSPDTAKVIDPSQ